MKFGLFVYCTVGRRAELEQGMAGRRPELYQRMIQELGDYAAFGEERVGAAGGFGVAHGLGAGGVLEEVFDFLVGEAVERGETAFRIAGGKGARGDKLGDEERPLGG